MKNDMKQIRKWVEEIGFIHTSEPRSKHNGHKEGAHELLAKLMILYDSRLNGFGPIGGKKRQEAAGEIKPI